jgi:hypothetical protein
MEDVYEVGIRLVLENGVSAGIAALQDDLAAYDRALAATTGRLRTVADAGHGLAPPVISGGDRPAGRSLAVGEEMPFPSVQTAYRRETPVLPPAVPQSAARSQQPAAVVAPVKPAQPVAVRAPGKPAQPATASAPAMPRVTLAGRASAAPERALPPPLPAPAAPEQPVRAAAPVPGSAPPARGQAITAVTVMAVPPPRYARYAPAVPAAQPAAVAAPDVADDRPVSMPASDRGEIQQAPLAVRELLRSSTWSAAPPVGEPASVAAQVAPRAGSTPSAGVSPAAPVAAAASSGPVQGDVYLDGARVGRWMSDRLAREADRPQAGVTGFDPRLGPAWPGSLHGT